MIYIILIYAGSTLEVYREGWNPKECRRLLAVPGGALLGAPFAGLPQGHLSRAARLPAWRLLSGPS